MGMLQSMKEHIKPGWYFNVGPGNCHIYSIIVLKSLSNGLVLCLRQESSNSNFELVECSNLSSLNDPNVFKREG